MERTNSAGKIANLPWAHLRLPPFPQVAVRVLQLVNNENVQLHRLSDLISSDPAFASEVLTVANSALYALRYPANSILQAVAVLGGNALEGMCITVGVRAYLGKSMAQPAMKVLWRHNLACAIVADRLAAHGPLDKEIAYTAGILHDIGRAALAVVQPREYAELLARHRGTAESMLEEERVLFGLDHCETGLRLIDSWHLPSEFKAAVAHHHGAADPGSQWNIAALVRVACRMADAVGYPAFAGCACTSYPELLAELPEEARAGLHSDGTAFAAEIAEAIHSIEAA